MRLILRSLFVLSNLLIATNIAFAAKQSPLQRNTCAPLPPLEAAPTNGIKVTDFGAKPDDEVDDTAAMERAIASLKPGQTLVFPTGRYLQQKRLKISTPNVSLWGVGAEIRATNPKDSALLVQASGVKVLGFTLTAVTDQRRSAPWESRIAVWRDAKERKGGPLKDVVIRGNRIIPFDAPGTAGANSSSSAAIFISGVSNFLVAENRVERSLSDGIHVTGGARDGRVIQNVVRENGDDMIAVVSYLGDGDWKRNQTRELAATLKDRMEDKLVRNVLIADNDVEGNYWGRGITVVGGRNVTIRNNRIANTSHAAAIYIAREQGYVTFGVRDVLVENNVIDGVKTREAPYNPLPLQQRLKKTGHGAIEITARVFEDELAAPELAPELAVERIRVVGNRISDVRGAAIRVAEGSGKAEARDGDSTGGERVSRLSRGGTVRDIDVSGNNVQKASGRPVQAFGAAADLRMGCSGNSSDAGGADDERCSKNAVVVTTGAMIDCK